MSLRAGPAIRDFLTSPERYFKNLFDAPPDDRGSPPPTTHSDGCSATSSAFSSNTPAKIASISSVAPFVSFTTPPVSTIS